MSKPIYLDHNASTPVLSEVMDAMLPFLREHFGNPSSAHAYAVPARTAIANARRQVAALIGGDEDEIVFTSGGTEANNLAIRGVAEARIDRRRIVTTVIEHPAVSQPCAWLQQHGYDITRIGVDATGRSRIDQARHAIDANTALVTVMHSNSETGTLQPVREIAELARANGATMHTDAAQSVGKVPVNVQELGVDLLSVVGHKMYAPKGVGALYVRRGTPLVPVTFGAGHERGLRPGTENVAYIVGLGTACAIAARDLETIALRLKCLRDALWARLAASIPDLALHGDLEHRLPNTLNVRFPRVSGNAVLAHTPEVAASTGSACHAGDEKPSAVILAMGIAPQEALGAVRLTLGRGTTDDDVTRAADVMIRGWSAATARTGLNSIVSTTSA